MFFVIINCSSYFYRTHASNVRILMMGASSAIVGLAAGMGSVNVDGDEGAEQGCKLKPQGSGRTGSGWRGRGEQAGARNNKSNSIIIVFYTIQYHAIPPDPEDLKASKVSGNSCV
ncbi:hypothetical protein K438DRAFT_1935587 [Mycena galopus ATCC 62051]|nr:hypothetical protein K438DRAFT_1948797 [Mycena galopus ATCC 62051]KAF8140740.1 hypothetical protein K438DRAFT_1946641 [Mycena galopus ATCC 62051]KAF8181196.1 hypothetical protein K438DRAFT_1768032 [Mycena galopus ATCC 62051]KAF8190632.1 hypothetical protein K438DRAFT_1935587 [Mycena galopus ATCC 62051]